MRYILSFSQVCFKTQMGYCHCIIKCNVWFFKHAIIGREKLILRYYQWEFHRTIHYLTIIWKEYLLLKAASKTIKWITLCSIFFKISFLFQYSPPSLQPPCRSRTDKNTGFGVRRSSLGLTSLFIHPVTLESIGSFVCYLR